MTENFKLFPYDINKSFLHCKTELKEKGLQPKTLDVTDFVNFLEELIINKDGYIISIDDNYESVSLYNEIKSYIDIVNIDTSKFYILQNELINFRDENSSFSIDSIYVRLSKEQILVTVYKSGLVIIESKDGKSTKILVENI